ncbi:MAG: hypothetical protein P1P82_11675 [Bacteroidales bacterium]|nr:hypothetical protein [Bacteroidales bacterium]MDT8432449.1 hypothetical protein [Bacteroidales bacterium]
MLSLLRKSAWIWYVASGLLSIGFLLIIFADIGDTGFASIYFNSDMLYDPVIFRDIFLDGTGFKGWHLNAAPNFFPDMFFYFIFMALSGNFITANFLFSIFQYLVILALVLWLFRQVNRENGLQLAATFNFMMFLFLLVPVFTDRFHLAFQLISISYHMGSFIMYLLSLNLLLLYLRKKSGPVLVLLFFSALLGVINDRLFISQFVFSLLPLVLLLLNHVHRKILLRPLSVIIAATILGLGFFRLLKVSGYIYIIGTGFKMFNFENLAVSWNTFVDYILRIFRNYHAERGILIIFIFALVLALVYLFHHRKLILKPEPQEQHFYQKYLIIVIASYLPVTLLIPVINGAFVAESIIRFNVMAFFMGIMLLPLVLGTWKMTENNTARLLRYLLPVTTFTFLVLFGVKIATVEFSDGMRHYFDYYPEKVRVIDELKEEHGLKYGVGDYWYAKYTTMFSRKEVRIYTIFSHALRPFYHSTNENWYHDGGKGRYRNPVFNFTVRKINADSEKLKSTFQERLDTIYINNEDNYIVMKLPEFKIDRSTREFVLLD